MIVTQSQITMNRPSLNQRNIGPLLPVGDHKKAHSQHLDLKHRKHMKSLEVAEDRGRSFNIEIFLVFLGPRICSKNWRKISMKYMDNGGSSSSFFTLPQLCVHARQKMHLKDELIMMGLGASPPYLTPT